LDNENNKASWMHKPFPYGNNWMMYKGSWFWDTFGLVNMNGKFKHFYDKYGFYIYIYQIFSYKYGSLMGCRFVNAYHSFEFFYLSLMN